MEILVKFYNRAEEIRYTESVLGLLRTDKSVEYILNAQTGEVIYNREV